MSPSACGKILITKLSALGDVLRTTSLLRPLKRRYPRARITWLTGRGALPLLERNPLVDELLTVEDVGEDLEGRFDLVLSLEEDARTAGLAERACRGTFVGVRVRRRHLSQGRPERGRRHACVRPGRRVVSGKLVYTRSSARYYDMSLLNRSADGGLARADALKAANKLTYAELWLKVLGLPKPKRPADLRPVLALSTRDRAAAAAFARRHGLTRRSGVIGLNPGAGRRWPAKQLSVASSARLIRALRARLGRPVVLFGGRDEGRRNAAIARAARGLGTRALDAGTRHDLRSFAGFIDLCDMVVTTDTLALHVATALGKKTFVLVGPTSAAELDVFGRGEKITPASGCACFYKPRCRLGKSCLDRLPPDMVAWIAAGWA